MEVSTINRKRRGPYKKYLHSTAHSIPKTSRWRLKKSRDEGITTSTTNSQACTSNSEPCEPQVPEVDSEHQDIDMDYLSSLSSNSDAESQREHPCFEDSFFSSSDSDSSSAESHSCDLENEDDILIDSDMFKPIYENASISLCGAIMEYKRVCRLPFASIAKLLELLQLLCPAKNTLPQSIYIFRKFFQHRG